MEFVRPLCFRVVDVEALVDLVLAVELPELVSYHRDVQVSGDQPKQSRAGCQLVF